MARPVMRDLHGRWSLTQVAEAAGVTHRTARTMVSVGYLNPLVLTRRDVVVLKVVAALHDTLVPSGMTRTDAAELMRARNMDAARLVREFSERGAGAPRSALLMAFPTEVRLVEELLGIMGAVGSMAANPLLILPIGEWVTDLNLSEVGL